MRKAFLQTHQSPCKLLSVDQKIKLLKHAKNVSTTTLKLFSAKKPLEKAAKI